MRSNTASHTEFQSTLPREERLALVACCASDLIYFNPRSHERSDKKSVDDGDMMSISIHAPTRGATLIVHICHNHMAFQSTLPREERRSYNLYV